MFNPSIVAATFGEGSGSEEKKVHGKYAASAIVLEEVEIKKPGQELRN